MLWIEEGVVKVMSGEPKKLMWVRGRHGIDGDEKGGNWKR